MEKEFITRDLYGELRAMGNTHEMCDNILDWIDKLPICINGVDNIKVNIKQGLITIEPNNENLVKDDNGNIR